MNRDELAKEVQEFITTELPTGDDLDLEDAASDVQAFIEGLGEEDDDEDEEPGKKTGGVISNSDTLIDEPQR